MKATKTGKIRYRTQSRWFGKELVVLQMEWLIQYDSFDRTGRKEWREATVEDLTEEILMWGLD